MRVSGSGRTNVCEKPEAAPVVKRCSSASSKEGSTRARKASGVPGGKIVAVGAKFRVGWGRVV